MEASGATPRAPLDRLSKSAPSPPELRGFTSPATTSDDAVQAALYWLEDEGWLPADEVGGTGPGTGRRTWRYFINPKTVEVNKLSSDHSELDWTGAVWGEVLAGVLPIVS